VNPVSCVNTHCQQSFCFTKISVARSQEARKISYFDGLQFMDAKDREQPLPPNAVVGFRSEAGVAKDRSLAANIDANRALIISKKCQLRPWRPTTTRSRSRVGKSAVSQFAATPSRRFQFQKRRQFFIRVHNETLSVVAGASAIQIIRPRESTVATQPQLQPVSLRLSAMISQD
jgi:hypothetical protein